MKTNKIIYGALLIAMRIILQRFFGIQTPLSRISFAFVPAMMTGMFFNPITCGMIGVVTDVLGFSLFPKGTYFIGYTLSAFVGGYINSYFFYKKEITYKNVILAVLLNTVLVNIIMNTFWLRITSVNSLTYLLTTRIPKYFITVPIHIVLFMSISKALQRTSQFKKIIHQV